MAEFLLTSKPRLNALPLVAAAFPPLETSDAPEAAGAEAAGAVAAAEAAVAASVAAAAEAAVENGLLTVEESVPAGTTVN